MLRLSALLAAVLALSGARAEPKSQCVSTGCPAPATVACGQAFQDNCGKACGEGTQCSYGLACSKGSCGCVSTLCDAGCKDNCGNPCFGGACVAPVPLKCAGDRQPCGGVIPCCEGLLCTVVGGDYTLVCLPPAPGTPVPAPPAPLSASCKNSGEKCGSGLSVCCAPLRCTGGADGEYATCK